MNQGRHEELADSISDGNPIDWDDLEGSASPEERLELRRLHQLSRIAEFNRGLQRSSGPDVLFGVQNRPGPLRLASLDSAGSWGPLRLLEKLGEGSTGEVWRAWEERLQREVALKLLKPTGRPNAEQRLLDEGSHLARISHDGVARVYGIETHDGRIGLWMELLDGEALDRIVSVKGPFSPEETALIGARLCRALAAVHAAGLLHRDVKASNVIRTAGGRIVLTDFGLGSPLEAWSPSGAAARSSTGLSGTPMYMPPEVLHGEPATVRSEIFSLGILLYFLVSGRYPVEAGSLGALAAVRAGGGSRRLRDIRPELPVGFVRIVERATNLDPEMRYGTAGEMEAVLLASLDNSTDEGIRPAAPRGRRDRIVAGVIGASLVLAAVVGGSLVLRRRPASVQVSTVPYDVEASFVRLAGDRYLPLLSGDRVAPGDRLALDIRSSRPLHVYVLNEDERGEEYLLYPQGVYDQKNPVPAESTVRLPGTIGGAETAWKVTSAGGHEYFLVVGSPSPLPDLEHELAQVPAPEEGRPVTAGALRLTKPLGETLRGVGGLQTVASEGAKTGRLADVVRRLGGREAGVKGVWIRKIVLDNPR